MNKNFWGNLIWLLFGVFLGLFLGSHYTNNWFPWNNPEAPSVISYATTNAQQNDVPYQDNVIISATPDYVPMYSVDIIKIIKNNDSNTLDMFFEVQATDGFKFLPLDILSLPANISIDPGYEYKNILYMHIYSFHSKWEYKIIFPIATDEESLIEKEWEGVLIRPIGSDYSN